jgi:rRNA maturation protein Nop10
MAQSKTKELTKAGECPTHGRIEAVKEVPAFSPPGIFWAFRRLGSLGTPYRCPQCGQKVRQA